MNAADYDAWYDTSRGRWIGETELKLIRRMRDPQPCADWCAGLAPILPALRLSDEEFWLVRLAGIEPTTLGFGGQYSIH